MTMTNQNFSMYSGNTKNILVSVTSDGGASVTLDGSSVKWTLKEHDVSEAFLLQKTNGSGVSFVGGQIKIALSPADTSALEGTYYHECELTDAIGNVSTIFEGYITIK